MVAGAHRPAGARQAAGGARPVSVLAIDAGTTGVTALVVDEDGPGRGPRLRGVPAALPAAGLGRARARGDLAGDPVGLPRQALAGPARSPPSASPTSARRRCSGTARRCRRRAARSSGRTAGTAAICDRLRDAGHEDRVARADRAAPRPLLHRHQADLAGRARPARLGRRHRRLDGRRHRRLLPRRPADRRRPARHRRVQRLAHAAARHRPGRLVATSCASCFGVPRAALPEVVPSYGEVGRTRPDAFLGLDLPVAGIAGDQQAALFGQACFAPGESKCTYGTGSFVLVNTGPDVVRSRSRAADDRRVAGAGRRADLRARGRDLRHRRRPCSGCATGSASSAPPPESEALARDGAGQRRRGLRAGADRARRPGLGPGGARRRSSASPAARPGRTSPGPRSRRSPSRCATSSTHAAGASRTGCASTAAPRPTTCCCSCRPTSSAMPVERPAVLETTGLGRGVPGRPRAPGSGPRPTSWPRPGGWTDASSRARRPRAPPPTSSGGGPWTGRRDGPPTDPSRVSRRPIPHPVGATPWLCYRSTGRST